MKKLLILSIILSVYYVGAEVIPVAVQSHRQFEEVNVDDQEGGAQPYSPHVFEVEPSSSPLRIVFSSESSPLSLEAEQLVAKAFANTPVQHSEQAVPAPDVKQDRSGAVPADASPANVAAGVDAGPNPYNEDEYEIIDSYQRYVPVKIRAETEQVLGASDEQVVIIKPSVVKPKPIKVVKVTSAKQKVKKVRIPVMKATTAKPLAKQVASKPTTRTTKPIPAETMTQAPVAAASEQKEVKFGARLTRQVKTKNEKKEKKENSNKKAQN